MTEQILLSSMLYSSHRKTVDRFETLKIGQTGPVGKNESIHRDKGTRPGGPKASTILRIYDAMIEGNVRAMCGDDMICVTFLSRDEKEYSAICDGKSIDFLGNSPERNWEKFIPLFVFDTRPGCANEELYNAITTDPITDGIMLLACDSYYYGCAKKRKIRIDVNSGEKDPDFIKSALKTKTLYKKHPLCVPMSGAIKAEPVDIPPISKKEDEVDPFEEIRLGKHAIAYDWTDEQKIRIPSLNELDDFVPTSAFWKTSRKIKYRTDKILMRMDMGMTGLEALGKDTVNFFMTGKPGTGKTTIAKALAAAYQLPFYSVPIQKGTEEGTFQGLLKARDGKFEFCSTDFLNAFKNGGIIVLEELNLADPAILSGAIGQAVEAPYMIMEDELRPVYRHPLCIIVGTFNVGTAGSKEINPMLSSRFYQTYLVDDPSEDEFVERLMKFDCDKKTAKKVYNAYSRILDYLKSPDVSALEYCKNVTFRGCVGAIQCLQEGSTLKEAIEDTLVGKIAEYDLDLANDVLHTVVEVLPD